MVSSNDPARGIALVLLAALCLSSFGCTNKPQTCLVTGSVNFEGQPVAEGNIRFVSSGGATIVEDVAPIIAGKYSLQVHPGPKRVEILASREVPPPQPDMYATREEYIPPHYNTQSKLTANVTLNGNNVFDFDLKQNEPSGMNAK